MTLPAGYDSVYLELDGETSHKYIYKYDYVIFDKNQVQATHVVKFRVAYKEPAGMNEIHCASYSDNCSDIATRYCINDKVALCPECDEALHLEFPNERAAAVMSQHKVVDIKNKKTKFGKCRDHDRKFEFYCLTCHRPICVNCKIVGNHAGVELNNHWIIDIDKAYQRAKEEVEDDDPALKKKLS